MIRWIGGRGCLIFGIVLCAALMHGGCGNNLEETPNNALNDDDRNSDDRPTVSSVLPANGATNVAVNTAINVTFSKAMAATTITSDTFTLRQGTIQVSGAVSYDAANHVATFTPSSSLSYLTAYTATITTGAKDLAGNALAQNFIWTFTTGTAPDTASPTVSSTNPANNATSIPVNSAITAAFSKAMLSSSITTATFIVSSGTNSIFGTVSYSGTTATFTLSSNLAYSTTYTATITTGARDLAGNALAQNYTWTFTTGVAPDTTRPTVSSTSPANGGTSVAVNTTVSAVFSEAIQSETITSTNFRLSAEGNNVTGTVAYNGTTATLTPSSNLAYSTSYTATVTTGIKDLAGNSMAANYSWTFTTGAAPDTTPPMVQSTSPANNSTSAPVSGVITVTFSETMLASTINAATFLVSAGSGSSVDGMISFSGTTATFTPASNLAYSATYNATITTGAKDSAGNAMASDYSWSFTTMADPTLWTLPEGAQTISIASDGAGKFYVGSVGQGAFGGYDVFTATFNSNGALILTNWQGSANDDITSSWGVTINVNTAENYLWWGEVGQSKDHFSLFKNGVELATHDLPFASNGIVADDGAVYTATSVGKVTKIDKVSGATLCQFQPSYGGAYKGMFLYNGFLYVVGETEGTVPSETNVGFYDLTTVALNTACNVSWAEVWAKQWGTPDEEVGYGISVDNSGVYVGGRSGSISGNPPMHYVVKQYGLNGSNGWIANLTQFGGHIRNITLDNSAIYAVGSSVLVKLDKATGAVLNSKTIGYAHSIAIYNNVLYVADGTNVIKRYRADTLEGL